MKGLYLGVDGGGTKTLALLVDADGSIHGIGSSGPVNYQLIGMEAATANLQAAVQAALRQAGCSVDVIIGAVLGLAGLDFPVDWANWAEPIAKLLPGIDAQLVNDTWIALRAGTDAPARVVSVCGTGANTAGVNPQGMRMIGRGMTSELGCFAGASELIRMSLNAAFRSANGSGKRSVLEPAMLAALGLESYDQLAMLVYSQAAHGGAALMEQAMSLVPQLFHLANDGDEVVQEILISAGRTLGEETAAIIKGLRLGERPFHVVLAGGIWQKASNPLMRDAFCLAVHRVAPLAQIKVLEYHPVIGAVLLALDETGRSLDGIEKLLQTALEAAERQQQGSPASQTN